MNFLGEKKEVSEASMQISKTVTSSTTFDVTSLREFQVESAQQTTGELTHAPRDVTTQLPAWNDDVIISNVVATNSGQPQFLRPLASVTSRVGANARFRCTLVSAPARVTWLRNGEPVDDVTQCEVHVLERPDGCQEHELVVKEVFSSDDGMVFQVRASNSRGVATSVAKLNVQGLFTNSPSYPPQFPIPYSLFPLIFQFQFPTVPSLPTATCPINYVFVKYYSGT